MHTRLIRRSAFSLTELTAVVGILGALAAMIVPRVIAHQATSERAACFANAAEIELQVELWRRDQGSYPTADLSDIGADSSYFPDGMPTCPVDGAAYTIDTTSGLVVGHSH